MALSLPPNLSAADGTVSTQALRDAISQHEKGGEKGARPRFTSTGFDAIDRDLPDGGLAFGAVHEIGGPLAHGFAARILANLSGPVLWFRPRGEQVRLYAPALKTLGCQVERWLIAYTKAPKDLLWGLEEGLRSGALAAVVGEPETALGMTASRRLQLAAERGRTLGLVLSRPNKDNGSLSPNTLTSRWRADPAASPDGDAILWRVRLLKLRGGGANQWQVRAGDRP